MPIICESSIWTMFHAPLMVPIILRWLLDFQKICVPLACSTDFTSLFTKAEIKLFLCLNKNHNIMIHRDVETARCILNISIRCKWMVSFTPWPLHSWGNNSCYPLFRRMGEPQIFCGQWQEKIFPLLGIKSHLLGHQTCSLVTTLTQLAE